MTNPTKFAAHDNFSIYAIADTADAAVAKARDIVGVDDAQFSTAKVSDELAEQIETRGWNGNRQAFSVGRDGFIVDTSI